MPTAHDRIQALLEEGAALRYTGNLRRGGSVGLTDEQLLIVPDEGDGDPVSVPFENVDTVELQDLDWFLVVLSVTLVGFGAFSTTQNLLGGLALVAAGVVSLGLTYRKRNRATVKTHSRAKPIKLYPADPDGFYQALGRVLDQYRARLEDERERE